jgi:hypothetical protein
MEVINGYGMASKVEYFVMDNADNVKKYAPSVV